ncbi:elongation of very long chain fatty acids protein AAEL008004 isoform X4 [Apis mellifera]|uniref:Elongation of very long chain fatty acids protein n=1 Tax=Apis mellifera TaxID=7460 RepID=A0A7M7IX13_APIME|nr:elongation of very long chain fatty acids protein AAEL008004 isoform X4 [Apis mellifera]|eukprot:XP_016772517.1 elongation of very long chain fatty acids protein AAEL008004 isoform X4 [Apis mellifera]
MSILMQYVDRFHEILDKHADQRTTNWFMMSSPFPTLFICLSYVYGVKVLGPKLMENRKPFQLKNVLIVYNLFQMVFSAWLFYEMVHACWWYYFSKFTEFMDTIFFVLRKKNDHVSILHVIHHGCMPMSVWFGVKFTPGGHSTFFGLLNTFVHIVMYTYYLLAAMGPKLQPYLWWKKYLTVFQMIQFVAVMIHAFQLLFIDCNYPKAFVWWIGLHATMFFFLFNEFYQQSYQQKKKRKQQTITNGMKKDHQQNHQTNGMTNGSTGNSSGRRDAADYYVKGDSLAASELNLRKSYTTTE